MPATLGTVLCWFLCQLEAEGLFSEVEIGRIWTTFVMPTRLVGIIVLLKKLVNNVYVEKRVID